MFVCCLCPIGPSLCPRGNRPEGPEGFVFISRGKARRKVVFLLKKEKESPQTLPFILSAISTHISSRVLLVV